MNRISSIDYKNKRWFKANCIISLLGYNGRINTATYVCDNIPEENRKQFSGRETWYIDEYGFAILLLKGKLQISESARQFAYKFISKMINTYVDEHIDFEGEIKINPNEHFVDIISKPKENNML